MHACKRKNRRKTQIEGPSLCTVQGKTSAKKRISLPPPAVPHSKIFPLLQNFFYHHLKMFQIENKDISSPT
ncbi:hypothetical protein B296_00051347 [Ensete ventricosum]|uniref:Uncharacterized protein n=1 Tax=Ensete ventricosum TaxID=4639 RepID=A0A426YEP2_ENSVE|nr:hypothetical protein B296_00051347 [Ensete ventricosum]